MDEEGQVEEMWICVHDKIFGGKSRKLAENIGCSQDEAVGLLVKLWIWGLTNCDRTGLIQYASTDTIAEVLVQGLSKELEPADIVDALIDSGYLDVEDDLIYIHDWADWQQYYYSYVDRKTKNTESKRNAREAQKSESTPRPAGKEDYSPEFERWWKIYPRKINKIDAFAKYKARLKEGYDHATLMAATQTYAAIVKKTHKEKQFVLHPETFLGPALRFRDYLPEEPEPEESVEDPDSWDNALGAFEKWRDKDVVNG